MSKGFTFIELIVVLVVGGIIVAIGAPALRATIQNNRITTQINDLHLTMSLARSEALKRGARITVCISADMDRCGPAGSWSTGWIVFVDDDENGSRAPGEPVIRGSSRLKGGNSLDISSNSDWIAFLSTGESIGDSGLGVFALCDDRGINRARGLVVRRTGSVRVTRDATEIGSCPS